MKKENKDVEKLGILQLHYYLAENLHSMDAKTYNKVETEFLKIVEETSKILDISISTEIQALEEGGIKAIYKFWGKKKNKKALKSVMRYFLGILGVVIADVISDEIKSNPEYEELKMKKTKLEYEKLKRELKEDSEDKEQVEKNKKLIDSMAIYISEANKIKLSKSKLYDSLQKEKRIEKFSVQELDFNFKPKSKENFVPRKDFEKFIINNIIVDSDYKYDVTLEIISPVLNQSKYSWRALYEDKVILFNLKDDSFKNDIISKGLQFSNGTKLVCELDIKQKINDEGEIVPSKYLVYNVSQIIYTDGTTVDV
jgi:hypothetical protein